jgi:hypothetical protein
MEPERRYICTPLWGGKFFELRLTADHEVAAVTETMMQNQ